MKIGVLGSGRGSNFVAIAEEISAGKLPVEIMLVASDHADAPILTEAKKRGLRAYACPPSRYKTKLEEEIETALANELEKAGVELVVLAGYMRVVKSPLLDRFRIINIHPSLLPSFPGLRAWEQALKAGVKETGCTVHWVDSGVDTGKIIAQVKVAVMPDDTAETLHHRIQIEEHKILPEVLRRLAREQALKSS